MEVGNVLIWRDERFGNHRYYEVVGIFLGGQNEESLIEIRSLGAKPGWADEMIRPTTFVPEFLVRTLEVKPNIQALLA